MGDPNNTVILISIFLRKSNELTEIATSKTEKNRFKPLRDENKP